MKTDCATCELGYVFALVFFAFSVSFRVIRCPAMFHFRFLYPLDALS